MTVAVAVKVFDGIVLAADSATTLPLANGSHQVYNHANKVFHLHRKSPVGCVTWGSGQVGSASIETLAKHLRRRLMGRDNAHKDWQIDPEAYTVEQITERLVEMIWGELYSNQFANVPNPPILGFLVAGYDADSDAAVAFRVLMDQCASAPRIETAIAVDQSGWLTQAQPEASCRLLNGYDPALPELLKNRLDAGTYADVLSILQGFHRVAVIPPMPFADAIAFARYLVDVTTGYSHYLLGPDTVGGTVELAGITRHEGFKWINRKHFYSATLNPEDPPHDY